MWTYRQTDELYHYGILGMKWGVRKKYPTTFNRTGTKKGANYSEPIKRSLNRTAASKAGRSIRYANDKSKNEAYKHTNEYKAKRKKAIKVGAAVVGTALAAYGAKKVYDIQKDNKARVRNEIARQTINRAMESYVNRPLYPGQLSRTVNTYYD